MSSITDIYLAEILRAAVGTGAGSSSAADLTRLRQIAARLADCEEAQSILRAKGYGQSGMTFVEEMRDVPVNAHGILKKLFKPALTLDAYPDLGEVSDFWSAR